MKVKTFRAHTLRAALDQVRAEMGDEAFILATKEIKEKSTLGLMNKSIYEVAAAVEQHHGLKTRRSETESERRQVKGGLNLRDESPARPVVAAQTDAPQALSTQPRLDQTKSPAHLPNRTANLPREESRNWEREALLSPRRSSSQASAPTNELKYLHRELHELKIAVGSLMHDSLKLAAGRLDGLDEALSQAQAELLLELHRSGVDAWLVEKLVQAAARYPNITERSAVMEIVSAQIRKLARLAPAEELAALRPHRAVFVGPTGVGKTTTIAKVAARAALEKRCPVELITIDTYRIAAIEQLRIYAQLIGVPLNVAHNVAELDAVLRRIGPDKLVLIDTAGCNQNNLSDQMELAEYLRQDDSLVKHLVVSASTKPDDTRVATEKFAIYGINRLAFTKLDETYTHGVVLNEAARTQLPLSYLANGQCVPEALLIVSPDILTKLVVSGQSSVASCR